MTPGTLFNRECVSIIIPIYNSSKWLRVCVESCLNQNFPVEIIIIDDGSSDDPKSILQTYAAKIRYERIPHGGANRARNKGFAMATGRWVKFLDADDFLEKNILAAQVRAILKAEADICYADWTTLKTYDNGREIILRHSPVGQQEDLTLWLLKGQWCPPFAYLLRRSFLTAHRILWNEDLQVQQDFDFIFSVALANAKTVYMPQVAGYYRMHSGPRVSKTAMKTRIEVSDQILTRAICDLERNAGLSTERKQAISEYYLGLAKNAFNFDKLLFRTLLKKMIAVYPSFKPAKMYYRILTKIFGYEKVEAVLQWRRTVRNHFSKDKF